MRDASPAQVIPPEKPAAANPARPTSMEPDRDDRVSSGEPEGRDSGREIDWGSHRLETKYRPLEAKTEWSPKSESEKECDWGDAQGAENLQAGLSEEGRMEWCGEDCYP